MKRKDGLPTRMKKNDFEIIYLDGNKCVRCLCSGGKSFILDYSDWEKFCNVRWCISHYGYAVRRENGTIITLHSMMLGSGHEIDHINMVKTDNRRSNLRVVSRVQNSMNKTKYSTNKSGFKGVSMYMENRWVASLTANGVNYKSSGFTTPQEAALAYNELAKKHHGEFARLNVVP